MQGLGKRSIVHLEFWAGPHVNPPRLLILARCVGAGISENTSSGCLSRCAIVPHTINRCSCHPHIFQRALSPRPSLASKEAWGLQSEWLKNGRVMLKADKVEWGARTKTLFSAKDANLWLDQLHQHCILLPLFQVGLMALNLKRRQGAGAQYGGRKSNWPLIMTLQLMMHQPPHSVTHLRSLLFHSLVFSYLCKCHTHNQWCVMFKPLRGLFISYRY